MKTIRRILAFALVLMLTMSLGVNAIAADAKYQLTRDFVSQVTGVEGLSCTIGTSLHGILSVRSQALRDSAVQSGTW